jgi:rhodanese-related sulfurtransferase
MSDLRQPDPQKAKAYFEEKLAFTAGPYDVKRWLDSQEKINVVDLRDADSYAEAHIPGAIHLPKDKWNNLSALRKDKTNVVYCYTQTCHLAAKAAAEFAGQGFPVMEMEGGFEAWKSYQMPIEKAAVHA